MSQTISTSSVYMLETNHGFLCPKLCFCSDGSMYDSTVEFEIRTYGQSFGLKRAAKFSSISDAHKVFVAIKEESLAPDLVVLHIYEERTVIQTPEDELDIILQEFNK